MKKLIFGGLFLASVGIIFFACSKKKIANINEGNLNETVNFSAKSTSEDTVNLIFDQTEAKEISSIFKVIQNSLLDLTKNSLVVDVVSNILEDTTVNEKIYLKVLESRLASHNLNLLDEMEASLIRNGGTSSDLVVLRENYNEIEIGNLKYETFIFVPFSDEVNYTLNPVVSFSVNNSEDMTDITGIQLYSNNAKETIEVEESLARTKQVWVISLSDINNSDLYPALPWQKCYCSRGGAAREDNNGDVVEGSRGSCIKSGQCGFCDRANIWGNCPRSGCGGC